MARADYSHLAAEEWNFASITEEQLPLAIRYEYARSCDWIVASFRAWHRRRIEVSTPCAELRPWRRLMVGEVLQKQRSGESVPPDVMDFILQSMPDEIQEDSIHDVFLIDSCFPDPFSKAHNVLLELVEHLLPTEPKAFRVLEKPRNLFPGATWAWDDPNYVEQAKKKGVEKITVLIDRTCSKPQLKKEMCAWVDTTDVSAIQKRRVLKGKAASPPWHRLRELAAYRLPIGCLTTRE